MTTGKAKSSHYLVFDLDDRAYAIALESVERVIPAVWITPIKSHLPNVTGVINVHGTVMPVVDLRADEAAGVQPLRDSDHFVVFESRSRKKALWIGSDFEVLECDSVQRMDAACADGTAADECRTLLRRGLPVMVLNVDEI